MERFPPILRVRSLWAVSPLQAEAEWSPGASAFCRVRWSPLNDPSVEAPFDPYNTDFGSNRENVHLCPGFTAAPFPCILPSPWALRAAVDGVKKEEGLDWRSLSGGAEHKAGSGLGRFGSLSPWSHRAGTEAGTAHWEPVLPRLHTQGLSWSLSPGPGIRWKGQLCAEHKQLYYALVQTGPRGQRRVPGLSHSLGDQEHFAYLCTGWAPPSWPHPVFSHEFLLSKKRHLCILKSQAPVLNVPTSERKHIAFPTVVQGKELQPRCVLATPKGLLGARFSSRRSPWEPAAGSAAVNFHFLFVYKCF